MRRLKIFEGTVILHHRGQLLAGRMSGSTASLAIRPDELPVLAEFLAPRDAVQAVQELVRRGASREALARRLSLLHQRGILVDAASADAPAAAEPLHPASLASAPAPERRWRLPRNFALHAVAGGFTVWSARDQREYRLDAQLATLLVSFLDGHELDRLPLPPELAGASWCRAAVGWLVERGLLVAAGQSAAVHQEATVRAPKQVARAPTWRDLAPDGRIPIYFMPHMENHYPLALGMIFSSLQTWNGGRLMERYQPIPITYLPPKEFFEGPYRKFGRGVWMFSNYMWSDGLNLDVSRAVKRHDAGNVCIHGGPSTPNYEQACRDFMQRHPSVDVAVHGEGELTTAEVLERIQRDEAGVLIVDDGLGALQGITFRRGDGELVRTEPRLRMREPDIIPSPYAEGVFDAYEGRVEAAIVETNRGCPFKCTFCDWGSATNQKVSRFEMDRVRGEIEWIGRNRVGVLWIADANFGMLKRDLEIAEWIVEVRRRHGYPREVVVNYTKNANERLARIIKVFSDGGIISQGIISIQTSDEETLKVIDRQNIKTEKYDELIEIFSDLGLPLSTDLMIGLPGITPAAFDRDLQRYFDADVAVKAYPTQLLPNSPMAHPAYLERYRIQTDADGYLLSCSSYSEAELARMKAIYQAFTAADGYSALRYVLRFVQWEYGHGAVRVLHDLLEMVQAEPDRLPAVTWVLRFFNREKILPGGWRSFYDQVGKFLVERYAVRADSALAVVLAVNEAVMPDEVREYPLTLDLAHDFERYFIDHNRLGVETVRPLIEYGPASLTISDPNNIRHIDIEHQQYDSHQYFWELHSPICRPQSIAGEASEPVATALAS